MMTYSNPYSDYGYGYGMAAGSLPNIGAGIGICSLIALIAALVIFFVFLRKGNEYKFTGVAKWFYDFLSFKAMLVEAILKIGYMFITIFTIMFSFVVMFGGSFGVGLLMLLFGIVIERIIFEFLLINVIICSNTSDINNKTAGHMSQTDSPVNSEVVRRSNPTPAPQPAAPKYNPPKYNPPKYNPPKYEQPVAPVKPAPDYRYNPGANNGYEQASPQTRICPGCGTKLKATAKFCQVCGQSVN